MKAARKVRENYLRQRHFRGSVPSSTALRSERCGGRHTSRNRCEGHGQVPKERNRNRVKEGSGRKMSTSKQSTSEIAQLNTELAYSRQLRTGAKVDMVTAAVFHVSSRSAFEGRTSDFVASITAITNIKARAEHDQQEPRRRWRRIKDDIGVTENGAKKPKKTADPICRRSEVVAPHVKITFFHKGVGVGIVFRSWRRRDAAPANLCGERELPEIHFDFTFLENEENPSEKQVHGLARCQESACSLEGHLAASSEISW